MSTIILDILHTLVNIVFIRIIQLLLFPFCRCCSKSNTQDSNAYLSDSRTYGLFTMLHYIPSHYDTLNPIADILHRLPWVKTPMTELQTPFAQEHLKCLRISPMLIPAPIPTRAASALSWYHTRIQYWIHIGSCMSAWEGISLFTPSSSTVFK